MITLAEVNALRRSHHRSVLLYLTDRCPVGCAHCSVAALRTSPTITDHALFERVVDGVCSLAGLRLVGISGGEPFIEKRALTLATTRISAAAKRIVLYTSGVWAKTAVPAWVPGVLRLSDCVFLSTDAQHAERLSSSTFVRASLAIVDAGANLVVQVINTPPTVAAATSLLREAFGDDWSQYAELSLTRPLTYGRGADVFAPQPRTTPGAEFGVCEALASPVVRYDGQMSACCNESLISGNGPDALRTRVHQSKDVALALTRWTEDPVLGSVEHLGFGPMTELPALADLHDQRFSDICDLCWKALPKLAENGHKSELILRTIAATREASSR